MRPGQHRLLVLLLGALVATASPALAGPVTFDDSGPDETVITIRLDLCPGEGVSADQLQAFVDRVRDEVRAIWRGNPGPFRAGRGAPPKSIRIEIEFNLIESCDLPRDPDRYRFKVHPGRPPEREGRNASAGNLYLENTPRTVAHEIGHAFGLGDEYKKGGTTRDNLMGRGNSRTLTDSHIVTILFLHKDNPTPEELRKRRTVAALLRIFPRDEARARAIENGCTPEQFDALVGLLDANGVPIQPGPPER